VEVEERERREIKEEGSKEGDSGMWGGGERERKK
jgi:hypothetical protein